MRLQYVWRQTILIEDNLMKKIVLLIIGINSFAIGMQQQQQTQQQEQRQQDPHQNHDAESNDKQPNTADSEFADLNALMQNLIDNAIQVHGSVDAAVKQNQKRKILCDICHREDCPLSREEEF